MVEEQDCRATGKKRDNAITRTKSKKNCRNEIVKRCVQKPNSDCNMDGDDVADDVSGQKNCTHVMKEVCEEAPVMVERLQRVRECRAEPVTTCARVPIRTCLNKCDAAMMRRGRKVDFQCRLKPRRRCVKVNDFSASCPRSSCRRVERERCRTRMPGCKVMECTKTPRRSCRIVMEKNCPEPKCDKYPVRKCEECPKKQFCHDHVERVCSREPRKECFPDANEESKDASCRPRCSVAYVCPVCRQGRSRTVTSSETAVAEKSPTAVPKVSTTFTRPRAPPPRRPLSTRNNHFSTNNKFMPSLRIPPSGFPIPTRKVVPTTTSTVFSVTSRPPVVSRRVSSSSVSSPPLPIPPFVTYYKKVHPPSSPPSSAEVLPEYKKVPPPPPPPPHSVADILPEYKSKRTKKTHPIATHHRGGWRN